MDVPTRASYIAAVVRPEERAAAASVTLLPRSLVAAMGPSLGGALFALAPFAWPFLIAGVLKAGYDVALYYMFRAIKPPEER
jgi:predicted MFS family arabinose efflux permease